MEVSVTPNPASDWIRIRSAEAIKAISIVDPTGRTLQTSAGPAGGAELSVSSLPVGSYHVLVTTEKGLYLSKLVIQR